MMRDGIRATLAGLGQLSLAGSWRGGVLVLAAMLLLSPWSALMASTAAAFATTVACLVETETRRGWLAGMSGFNAAVIGVYWAGAFAAGETNGPLLLTTIALCMGLEALCRRALVRVDLPTLILPAMLTLWAVSAVLAPADGWFWLDPPLAGDHVLLLVAAALLILTAMALPAPGAAALALGLALAMALAGVYWFGRPALSLFELWGLNVPLATYAVAAVFLPGTLAGLVFGAAAGLVAGAIWIAWIATGGVFALPPLLAPYVLSVWLILVVARRLRMAPVLQRDFWRTLWALIAAAFGPRPVIVILSPGVGWESDEIDRRYVQWIDPDMPRDAYSLARFRVSQRCRQAYWDACDRLRSCPDPRPAPRLMAADLVLDGDPRPWPGAAPTTRVAINGELDRVACLDCGQDTAWPPRGVWRHADLRCPACGGLLKPGVDLLAEDASPSDIDPGKRGILIMCGPDRGDRYPDTIAARTRAAGGRVIHLPGVGPCHPTVAGDAVIAGDPLSVLARLDKWLAGARRVAALFGRHRRAAPGAVSAAAE